ncbi:hypothetical protein UlMin_012040 [Ulmus minor]
MFINCGQSTILIVLVYVDDIIVTGSSESQVSQLITRLNNSFALRDLGQLSYFLGIEVTYSEGSMHLSQTKYISDLLKRTDMTDCKPAKTPGAVGKIMTQFDGEPYEDVTQYRSIVDWAGSPDDRRSASAYCLFLGNSLISWSATKQKVVSQTLLKELCIPQDDSPILWCDNESANYIATNSVFHARTKHVEIDLHFVRDRVVQK